MLPIENWVNLKKFLLIFLFKSPYHDFESWLICEKILLVQTRNEFYIFKKMCQIKGMD